MTVDRDLIIETTIRVAWYADRRLWDEIPGLFAEEVLLDYTSLTGGDPTRVAPAEIAASWQANLGGLDATQHLISNHLVEITRAARATAPAQFLATHVLANPHGAPTWVLGGYYHWTLIRAGGEWKIDSMTMTAAWATGNQQIMTLATTGSGS